MEKYGDKIAIQFSRFRLQHGGHRRNPQRIGPACVVVSQNIDMRQNNMKGCISVSDCEVTYESRYRPRYGLRRVGRPVHS
jgi:hypothetical protein